MFNASLSEYGHKHNKNISKRKGGAVSMIPIICHGMRGIIYHFSILCGLKTQLGLCRTLNLKNTKQADDILLDTVPRFLVYMLLESSYRAYFSENWNSLSQEEWLWLWFVKLSILEQRQHNFFVQPLSCTPLLSESDDQLSSATWVLLDAKNGIIVLEAGMVCDEFCSE